MILWRAVYWDPLLGDRTIWGESEQDVRERVTAACERDYISEPEPPAVEQIQIPTYKRGLIAWLNQNEVRLREVGDGESG